MKYIYVKIKKNNLRVTKKDKNILNNYFQEKYISQELFDVVYINKG